MPALSSRRQREFRPATKRWTPRQLKRWYPWQPPPLILQCRRRPLQLPARTSGQGMLRTTGGARPPRSSLFRRRTARRESPLRSVRPGGNGLCVPGAAGPHRCSSDSRSRFFRWASAIRGGHNRARCCGRGRTPGRVLRSNRFSWPRRGGGAPGHRHAPCGLITLCLALCPVTSNVFRADSQPLQESLVCGRVACFEQLVPPFSLRLVQADLLEHGDPFLYVHMVFHTFICIMILPSVQSCHGHDRGEAKV